MSELDPYDRRNRKDEIYDKHPGYINPPTLPETASQSEIERLLSRPPWNNWDLTAPAAYKNPRAKAAFYYKWAYIEQMRQERVNQFDLFVPFISMDGLEQENKALLTQSVKSIFTKTYRDWEPKLCQYFAIHTIDGINEGTIQLPEQVAYTPYSAPGHEFGVLHLPHQQDAIIDPTGIEIPYPDHQIPYLPFFGLVEAVSNRHLRAKYLAGKPSTADELALLRRDRRL